MVNLLPLLLVVLVAGCGTAGTSQERSDRDADGARQRSHEHEESIERLDCDSIDATEMSGIVSNATHWQDFWNYCSEKSVPRPDPPAVDFDRYDVAYYFAGTSTSDIAAMRVTEIWKQGDRYDVVVLRRHQDCFPQAQSNPALVFKVLKFDGSLGFQVTDTQEGDC